MFGIKKSVWWVLWLSTIVWPVLATDEKPAPAKTPAAETADPLVVPDGTPKELVAYITDLAKGPPPRDAGAMAMTRRAILQAAEKILAAKPGEPELSFAVHAKMNMLEGPKQLAEFITELTNAGHKNSARQVRCFMLQTQLGNAMVARSATMQKLMEEAIKFLQESPPQLSDRELAHRIGLASQLVGDKEVATKTYTTLAKIFAATEVPEMVEFSKMMEGVARRVNLVGQEMTIGGKVLGGGKALDWSSFRGKVVLVQFWVSYDRSYLAEVRNVKACYDLYHAKGFDVVGINLDRELVDVESFVKKNKIPWTIVVDAVKPNPAVTYYGIMTLPAAILVDKDGKVVSLNARGEMLGREVDQLLGSAEGEKQDPAKAKSKE